MLIDYIKKDITTVEMGVICHGVNCSGKMGSGVALAIRKKWPEVYKRFEFRGSGKALLGTADTVYITDSLIVINCYTQLFYGYGGGRYADPTAIEKSLTRAARIADLYNLPLYIPRLGCGLGGLDWKKEVEPIVKQISEQIVRVRIFVCDLPGEKQ